MLLRLWALRACFTVIELLQSLKYLRIIILTLWNEKKKYFQHSPVFKYHSVGRDQPIQWVPEQTKNHNCLVFSIAILKIPHLTTIARTTWRCWIIRILKKVFFTDFEILKFLFEMVFLQILPCQSSLSSRDLGLLEAGLKDKSEAVGAQKDPMRENPAMHISQFAG